MRHALIRSQISDLVRHPGRLLLTGLSVLIASGVVFGAVLAHQIVTRTTLDTYSETPDGVDLVISADAFPLSPETVAAIRESSGVAETTGRLTATFAVGHEAGGSSLDLVADPGAGPLSTLSPVTGRYPSRPDQIALDRRAAERLGAQPGSLLRLHPGDQERDSITVTVTGVVEGPAGPSERGYAPDTVVAALAGQDGYHRIDIATTPGTDPDPLLDRWGETLPGDPAAGYASITTGAVTRLQEAQAAVRQFDQIFALVSMFILISVAAAALVATSTFRIVFAQRLRQLALLRAVGAQSGQLVRALTAEGAVIGLVAGAVGVLLATAAGLATPGIAAAAGRTLSAPEVPVEVGLAVVIGAGALTVIAALAPAWSAAGVAPLQALRAAGVTAGERRISAGRLLLGGLLAAAAAALIWRSVAGLPAPGAADYRSSDVLLSLVGAGAFAFGTLIALGPVLIRPVLGFVGWPLRAFGPTGRLAVGVVGGLPRRAAAVSVVVALGVALIAGTVVGTSALRSWSDQTMAVRTPADLAMFADEQPFSDAVLTDLRQDSRFRHVAPVRFAEFVAGPMTHLASDLDLTALPALRRLVPAGGELAPPAPGTAILAHHLAEDLDAAVGDPVTLETGAGRAVRVTVAAVLPGEAPLRTSAVLAPTDLTALGAAPEPTAVLADVDGGSFPAALAAFRAAGSPIDAQVAVLADERDRHAGAISSLLAAALGLLGLTVLIAVTGVGTTTGLSVLERTRESGLLRALGLSRSRLRFMISIESGLYGVIGAVLGTALGVPLSWLALVALDLDLPLVFPAGQLLLIAASLTAVTVAAGFLPARRAARVSPVAALAVGE